MTVRANKPAFNVREKLKELERPIGVKGNELLRAETAQDARDLVSAGRKNVLINGDFQVSQRGNYSSATSAVDDAYFLDRWKIRTSGPTSSIQRQLVTLPNNQQAYSLKHAATSTGSGYHNIRQVIEDIYPLSKQTITLSCWIRGQGQPAYFRLWGLENIGDPIYLTSEWQHVSRQYTFGVLSSTTDGNANGATMSIGNYNGNVSITSGDYYEVAQFQIEIGKNATEFEHRSYGEELALCQRYYKKINDGSGNDILSYVQYTSVNRRFQLVHSPPLRSTPVVTLTEGVSGNVYRNTKDVYYRWYSAAYDAGTANYISNLEFDAEL